MDASPIRLATFDCYGTLIDWEGGLANFLYDMALRHEPEPAENGHALRERWEAIQFDLIGDDYLPPDVRGQVRDMQDMHRQLESQFQPMMEELRRQREAEAAAAAGAEEAEGAEGAEAAD